MHIDPKKLRQRLAASGLSPDELAAKIAREGLKPDKARAAIDLWLDGSRRRSAKGQDVRNTAEAIGCQVNDLRRFVGEYRFARISARKARLVVDMIRDKDYAEAWAMLQMSKKRAATFVFKTLESAVANAEDPNQGGLDRRYLRITEARVEEGPTFKRFQPKDRGRAFQILKRTCHITLAVDEIPE